MNKGYSRQLLILSAICTLAVTGCRSYLWTLTDDTGPGFWVQPYLQNPGPSSMTILWWTYESQPQSRVTYGEPGGVVTTKVASNQQIEVMGGRWLHEVTLDGLREETSYAYQVSSGQYSSEDYTFRTAPGRDSDLRIAFLGDGRTDGPKVIARHRRLVEMAVDSDLIFELGDEVYQGSTEHWGRLLREILTASDAENPGAKTASLVPYQLVVGNHELAYLPERVIKENPPTRAYYRNTQLSIPRFTSVVANPPNRDTNPNWRELYYVLRYGCATFIVLEANNTYAPELANNDYLAPRTTPPWEVDSEQYRWMIEQLERAQRESAFTFVLFHPSPYSSGYHGSPPYFRDSSDQRGIELRVLEPIFRSYGVDALLTSHDHIVEHSLSGPAGFQAEMDIQDPRNLNHLVMGNSGSSSRDAEGGWRRWMSVNRDDKPPFYRRWFYPWAGDDALASMVRLQIINNHDGTWTATFRIERNDGKIFNRFSIQRDDPLAEGRSG